MNSVICIGEVMAELSGLKASGSAHVGFGGDTANTAIYLSRLAVGQAKIGYLTRLGDDVFGQRIAESLREEGVELPLGLICPDRQTGLYAIALSQSGERSFSYWRSDSPARELLTGAHAKAETAFAQRFAALYISGISLAIMSREGRENLLSLAREFRADGRVVMLDLNHRAALWEKSNYFCQIAEIYNEFITVSSVIKAGLDELDAVFSPNSATKHAAKIHKLGAEIILISRDLDGLDVFHADSCQTVVPAAVANAVDTTAAGDSFNAGFLHEYLQSQQILTAVRAGQALAARVVMHQGAIIPLTEM